MPADELKIKKMLPLPVRSGGARLMDAIRMRRSIGFYSSREIPLNFVSNLLWAANGVNRPGSKGRTTATAFGIHNIQIYLAMSSGFFRYRPDGHFLEQLDQHDFRMHTGMGGTLQLIYVADQSKLSGNAGDLSAIHAGSMAENVYLFCASKGLGASVKGSIAPDALHQLFNLNPDQEAVLGQTVGYPAQPNPIKQIVHHLKDFVCSRMRNQLSPSIKSKESVSLPDPKKSGGMPLTDCLSKRMSIKQFVREEISLEQLSGLLWATWGFNRPMIGRRTAPSAFNCQNMSLYLVTSGCLYQYLPNKNRIAVLGSPDAILEAAMQTWMNDAAVTLIYAADLSVPVERIRLYSFAEAGTMSQNAALFCAGNGLGNVVFTSFNPNKISRALQLEAGKEVVLMQSVGIAA